MSVNDDPNEFKKNPLYLTHREFGDFTAFYSTITVCTIFGFALILLNLFFCYCSKHKYYWRDTNTGNRWILPLWTKTPYKQPPLDLSELEEAVAKRPAYEVYGTGEEEEESHQRQQEEQQKTVGGRRGGGGGGSNIGGSKEYLELHKRESDL